MDRFASNSYRARLMDGLLRALRSLREAGCARAFIDGSFVTGKRLPGDFDGCWDVSGVDPDLLDPVLLEFADHRRSQKEKFLGELFPARNSADRAGLTFLEFFQRDRDGRPKGIVQIDLETLP